MSAKMKKASKGKTGCLKPNGRLKKGWRWAKNRKGHCVPSKAKKAGPKRKAKKGGKKRSKRKAAQFGPHFPVELRIERDARQPKGPTGMTASDYLYGSPRR